MHTKANKIIPHTTGVEKMTRGEQAAPQPSLSSLKSVTDLRQFKKMLTTWKSKLLQEKPEISYPMHTTRCCTIKD